MTASIVVPIYNCEKTLHRCLTSIAAQTAGELEVLLVDDGSTDGSGEICRRWAASDPRFRVICQENRGPGAARNAGLSAATGRYLFFFDGDDTVEPDLVEQVLACFQKTGAEVVLYGCCHRYDDGTLRRRPLQIPRAVLTGREIPELLLPGLFTYGLGAGVSPWGKGYDLDFLCRMGIQFPWERGLACEDGEFMLRLFARVSRAALLPDCLYHYHRCGSSLSRRFDPARQQRNNAFLLRCREIVTGEGLPEQILPYIASRYHGLTLGTLTALCRADLSRQEREAHIRQILRDPLLHRTLEDAVLALDGRLPRLFWRCLRRKHFRLCRLLLLCNQLREARP